MTPLADWMAGTALGAKISSYRESRNLIVLIVAIALFLDNMLLTTVVPIVPKFIYELEHPNQSAYEDFNTTTASPVVISPPSPVSLNSSTVSDGDSISPTPTVESQRHIDLIKESGVVALMFACKAFVQLIANVFIGPITQRIGFSIPMFLGFVIMFLSTIIFAFGRSIPVLFIARALQGIGSSCSSVSGMGMLAEQYSDEERGNAMGFALGGLALGVLVGPPYGGAMYRFFGKTVPFLILSLLALGDGMLQLIVLKPKVVLSRVEEPPSLKELLTDPCIIIAAGAITFANMGIAMLEPSLTTWMMDTMNATELQQGLIFLPASIFYLIGTNIFGPFGTRIGRWLAALIGLIIIGLSLYCIPLATRITHLIIPNAGLGFAIGMVDSSMMPELGFLVDIRHKAVYGTVYAIGDVAFCLGFVIGPALSAALIKSLGFQGIFSVIATLTILYSPLLLVLRAPRMREEMQSLVKENTSSVRYVQYQGDEEEEEDE